MKEYYQIKADILNLIGDVQFYQFEGTNCTVCLIQLDDYNQVGYSDCINPDDFDSAIGEESAYNNAINKLIDKEIYKYKVELSQQD